MAAICKCLCRVKGLETRTREKHKTHRGLKSKPRWRFFLNPPKKRRPGEDGKELRGSTPTRVVLSLFLINILLARLFNNALSVPSPIKKIHQRSLYSSTDGNISCVSPPNTLYKQPAQVAWRDPFVVRLCGYSPKKEIFVTF